MPLSGQTPVVRATGQRFGCNMISAITNRGALAFMVFQGKFHNPVFIEFMKRLLRQAKGKLYLIVDGHPVHRSAAARRFVADNAASSSPDPLAWLLSRIEPGRVAQSGRQDQRIGQEPSDQQSRDDRDRASPSASSAEAARA